MSLLALYANIVWRGNGPGAIRKRKVAASLVILSNAPQCLVDLQRIAPGLLGADDASDAAALLKTLAADPCFIVLDGATVRLDVTHLMSLARLRLSKWVDDLFLSNTGPAVYLKNCLAKFIISEQDASVNVASTSLFTISWSTAGRFYVDRVEGSKACLGYVTDYSVILMHIPIQFEFVGLRSFVPVPLLQLLSVCVEGD